VNDISTTRIGKATIHFVGADQQVIVAITVEVSRRSEGLTHVIVVRFTGVDAIGIVQVCIAQQRSVQHIDRAYIDPDGLAAAVR
jgi:hypothetical protein